MRTLNVGMLAHVDAGKTTLTERLLYAAGVIDAIGSVDDGTTQTDSLALEQQRGITIKSAVASFPIDDVTINLIDTPGHPDFIAEVERVLSVLDGVVLVIAAVEGVQAQTRVLMRALQRLRIPTLLFVNKIDRRGADVEALIAGITELLPAAAGDAEGSVSASVFKVERGATGEKVAYARLFSGTINVRDRVQFRRDGSDGDEEGKVTAIGRFDGGSAVRSTSVAAGHIGKLWGLNAIQIGDTIGEPGPRARARHSFVPPTLESVVVPLRAADKGALYLALTDRKSTRL